jgi:hypothetical protein
MMKSLLLTAPILVLVATSEQVLAYSAVAPRGREATSDRLAANAFNAQDLVTTPQVAWIDTHRYHGAPKSND